MDGGAGKNIAHGTLLVCMTNFANILPRLQIHQALTRLMRRHSPKPERSYKLLVCKSASERCVDQRKIMAPTYHAELARAEQLAEFAGRHGDRTGLADARLSGGGQRIS